MKILVVGHGGREHALTWKLDQSEIIDQVYVWPGSPAMVSCSTKLDLPGDASYKQVIEKIKEQGISFVVVGPEKPLAEGFADLCLAAGIQVFGPQKKAAQLEASKSFAKDMMRSCQIPTADYSVVKSEKAALEKAKLMLDKSGGVVLKASGLAGGKGVFVCTSEEQVKNALYRLYHSKMSQSSLEVVVEEVLKGRECSFFVFVSDSGVSPLGFAVDFKRLKDNDQGPNTGGMGCYTPVPWLPTNAESLVMEKIVNPLLAAMEKDGNPYRGCLYVGLMWDENQPSVVEFNVRLGDPEAQALCLHDDRDWGKLIIQNSSSDFPGQEKSQDRNSSTVCVVLASGGYPYGEKAEIHPRLDEGLFRNKKDETCVFGASIKDSGQDSLDGGSGRIIAVAAKKENFELARSFAYQKVKQITEHWSDVQFRSDIGQRVTNEEK